MPAEQTDGPVTPEKQECLRYLLILSFLLLHGQGWALSTAPSVLKCSGSFKRPPGYRPTLGNFQVVLMVLLWALLSSRGRAITWFLKDPSLLALRSFFTKLYMLNGTWPHIYAEMIGQEGPRCPRRPPGLISFLGSV